ncbi:hypothetical protein ABMC88_13010 [Sulfitobacter sp. HNIBRBA2951]|uniref:hypothetical protein n=1 Tax=Sulfitobacter aquimarinus TaxID=3158557 RepID=UPI0032DF4F2D
MDDPIFIDLIRYTHLLSLVLGMGPALYYDLRSLHRIRQPVSQTDLDELRRIHNIVSVACVGMWLSGAALIWVRTQFDLSEFSPKLWCKVAVVSTLTVNATVLSIFVIPTLERIKGSRIVSIPLGRLVAMNLCAGVSLSCWMLALALGSSSVLKTAGWDLLLPVMLGVFAACICGVMAVMLWMRSVMHGSVADTVSLSS